MANRDDKTNGFGTKLNKINHLYELGVDGRMILKCYLTAGVNKSRAADRHGH